MDIRIHIRENVEELLDIIEFKEKLKTNKSFFEGFIKFWMGELMKKIVNQSATDEEIDAYEELTDVKFSSERIPMYRKDSDELLEMLSNKLNLSEKTITKLYEKYYFGS